MPDRDADRLPELDIEALARMRETFLRRIPSFGDFQDHPSDYWEHERGYKVAFVEMCRSALTPDLFPEPITPPAADRVVQTVRRLLEGRLDSFAWSQNFIGWRYRAFLREMTPDESVTFAEAFRELLFGAADGVVRAERFTAALWPVWSRTWNGNPYALGRIFPSLFLMTVDTANHLPVRSDMFEAATKSLVGKSLLQARPFSAEEYGRILAFSRAVLTHLQQWAWLPRDMIDVHSFLWVATHQGEYGMDLSRQ